MKGRGLNQLLARRQLHCAREQLGENDIPPELFRYGETRHISPIVDVIARLIMCLFGGTMLIVPMVTLVFVAHSRTLTLSLTTMFVLLVAVTLPLVCKPGTPNDTFLAATAAYAAVLVVFVANTSSLC
jgi:hypothetical protein